MFKRNRTHNEGRKQGRKQKGTTLRLSRFVFHWLMYDAHNVPCVMPPSRSHPTRSMMYQQMSKTIRLKVCHEYDAYNGRLFWGGRLRHDAGEEVRGGPLFWAHRHKSNTISQSRSCIRSAPAGSGPRPVRPEKDKTLREAEVDHVSRSRTCIPCRVHDRDLSLSITSFQERTEV